VNPRLVFRFRLPHLGLKTGGRPLEHILFILLALGLSTCAGEGSERIPVTELPDPVIYGLTSSELPEVGLEWKQTYNLTSTGQDYKWSYVAYQAYEPGSLPGELESGFAINSDIYLYEIDISRQDLPPPPQSIGNLQGISWKLTSEKQPLGDKSAIWKTALGEIRTPAWRLEFFRGHAYVSISLIGFPDQIALPLIYGLGDIVAQRLPDSTSRLRSAAATWLAARPTATAIGPTTEPAEPPLATPPAATPPALADLAAVSYTAPPGEMGMVSYFDDTGMQLTDGEIGADDILTDLGQGTAYEWVGWTEATDPITLTFTLSDQIALQAVEIGFNHRQGLGVSVPALITINGKSFELSADEVPNNQRKDIIFEGPFMGPFIQITLHHRGRGWMLLDEVRFIPGKD